MKHWILLRGLAREARHWDDFPAHLERAMTGIQVHRVDLPGAGENFRQRTPPSVHEIAEACRAQALPRLARERIGIVGLSLGGMVALDWTARHADEVERCVLINTSARGVNRWWRRLRPRAYAGLLRAIVSRGVARERAVLALTTCWRHGDESLARRHAAFALERPFRAGNLVRQVAAAATFRVPAPRLRAPVLFLASAHDALVDSRCSRELAACWHASYAVHPEAGHDIALDDPSWVAARIAEWIRRT